MENKFRSSKAMENVKLMEKVIELDTQILRSREQSMKVMVQISIIRKAYGVKNGETDSKVLNFVRERIMLDQEIEEEFNWYVKMWKTDLSYRRDSAKEQENRLQYFIEGVQFFDEGLAEKFNLAYMKELAKEVAL